MSRQTPKLTHKRRRKRNRQAHLRQRQGERSEIPCSGVSAGKRHQTKHLLRWSTLLVGLILLSIGLVQLTGRTNTESPPSTEKAASQRRGQQVTLIAYSDFQCPACAYYHRLLNRLTEELGDDLQVLYRHFPLKRIHPNAELAAQSAIAAGRQGKGREMQHHLFSEQNEWAKKANTEAERLFVQYAATLGLSAEQFRRDLHSQGVKDRVATDYQSGLRSGVRATPTFFINGQKVTTPRSYGAFKKLLEDHHRRQEK